MRDCSKRLERQSSRRRVAKRVGCVVAKPYIRNEVPRGDDAEAAIEPTGVCPLAIPNRGIPRMEIIEYALPVLLLLRRVKPVVNQAGPT